MFFVFCGYFCVNLKCNLKKIVMLVNGYFVVLEFNDDILKKEL